MSEASTNLAKFCGLRYGESLPITESFNEFFSKVRSEFFNEESKRRVLLGTFTRMAGYRNAFYTKALKVRTLIISEYRRVFESCDVLVSPTMPSIAPRFDEVSSLSPLENYKMDVLTVGPNLAGLPHISLPVGFINKLPVGVLLSGDHFSESRLVEVAKLFENG